MELDFGSILSIGLLVMLAILALRCVYVVNEKDVYVIERLGRYQRELTAGIHFIIPILDRVAYKLTTKEEAMELPAQTAITKDNISLQIDGVLYFKVIEAHKACYGVEDYAFVVENMAQTTMRAEIGKLELDKTFSERDILNSKIVEAINKASVAWGVQVMRYEILNLTPPASVMEAMEKQMRAEREKRALILKSEGEQAAAVNTATGAKTAAVLRAEGDKQAVVLKAEGDKEQQILAAEAEAKSIQMVADAQAIALAKIAEVTSTESGQTAVSLELAKKSIDARLAIAKESTVVLMDSDRTSTGAVVAEALAVSTAVNAALHTGKA